VTYAQDNAPFGNASAGIGAGTGTTADGFWGDSDHGVVVGRSATFGPGLGVTSFNGITNTYVQPLRRPKRKEPISWLMIKRENYGGLAR
jgi:hypothetical protein